LQLNKEETLSVASSKTFLNSPEVDQHRHTGGRKVVVYVISIDGKPLMPCKPAKARRLINGTYCLTKRGGIPPPPKGPSARGFLYSKIIK
jgi:hypothetical protein